MPARLFVFVALPLTAVFLIAGALVLRSLNGQLEKRLEREVEMVARALRLPVGHAMRNGNDRDIQRALDSALRIGRVYGASVFDDEGALVGVVGGAGLDEGEASRIIGEGRRTGEYRDVGGRNVYSYFVPLTGPGDRIIGLLQVTRTREDMAGYLATLRRWAGAVVGGVTALVLVIGFLGYYVGLGRSLDAFRRAIEAVEAGQRDRRAHIRGPREIGAVARSFNSMLDSIEEAEKRVGREQEARRGLEQKLRQAERLAAVGRLAAGVAHELGTPLSNVNGQCQRALRRDGIEPPVREALERSREEVRRMERLVRQLLDYGRPEPRERSRITVSRLLALVVSAVRDESVAQSVDLRVDAAPRDIEIFANVPRLEQALVNIIKNALQAASASARVTWRGGRDRVEIRVDDDGPGVPDADAERLFEPFFTTKPVGVGTGLGLSIAHAAVTEHGGTIRTGASSFGGARFTVVLPIEFPDTRLASSEERV